MTHTMIALHDIEDQTEEQVRDGLVSIYEADREDVDRFDILVASEEYAEYEGSSFYLLRERTTGLLFTVAGGHCSCMGMEGQFAPKPVKASVFEGDDAIATACRAAVGGARVLCDVTNETALLVFERSETKEAEL